eukprot:6363684-Amphidinium_carterae.1
MYRWSFAPSTWATCPEDAHRSRVRTTSRRFLLMITGHARPGSLTSSIREHFCQGDRQKRLPCCARATGVLPHLHVCEGKDSENLGDRAHCLS